MQDGYNGRIKPEFFRKIQEEFKRYKDHKQAYDNRIIENNRWYKSLYLSDKDEQMETPTTAYLFNTIANKHADAMDNYPEPNILEREETDKELAKRITEVLPIVLELCDFKQTYSKAWWYKLKNGAVCYGVFYNPSGDNGLGGISIKKIDFLNLFWEPGIVDIQDSRFIFLTALMDNDALKEQYPDKASAFISGEQLDVRTYDDGQNTNQSDKYKDKSLIIDCYYKKDKKVHLLKFCGDTILEASEDSTTNGIYEHGKYPFVFDVMYPDEDSPVGFGLIDIIKNPQLYIDKLDQIIIKNALISGKIRFMIKDNGGVNEQELADISKEIIHVAGNVSEDNIRQFQANSLNHYIVDHREKKITELKEIAGNRDFQQGGTTKGVTAYSAIVALQQAGEKLSRDMIAESYTAYKEIIYLCIELIRQFYDEPRPYRIQNDNGETEYVSFSNEAMKLSVVGEYGGNPIYRRAEFDVDVISQKHNPYNKVAENQTLLELWQAGIFNLQNIDSSLILLDCMQFESKEKIINGLKQIKVETEQKQAEQMAIQMQALKNQQMQQSREGEISNVDFNDTIDTPNGRMVRVN